MTSKNKPVTPSTIVTMALRFMGEDKIKSVTDIFGMDIILVQRVLDVSLDAVISSKNLFINIFN